MPANSEQFNEQQRLQTINEFYLRKAEPDEQLESLLSAIAELLNIPIALVSVIDQFEQFFKANVGLLCQSTRREDAFCNQVVQNNQLLIVEDALTHPLFAVNPLVTGEPHIRFYAGVPLLLNQVPVGAVCLIDQQPRSLTDQQLQLLKVLSEHVSQHLVLKKQQIQHVQEHSLLAHSPAVLMQWRQFHTLQLSYVSENITSIFGIPGTLLTEKHAFFEDFIVADDVVELHFVLSNHAQGVNSAEANFRLCNQKHQVFWVKLVTKAFFDEKGQLVAVHGMLLDHTSNRHIEQKLNLRNQQMRLLLEASNLGTWDWQLTTDTTTVNQRWCEIIGLDYELFEPSSQYWRQFIHPADRIRFELELQQHLQGDTKTLNTSYRMRHRRGNWVWVESFGKTVERDQEGKPSRVAGTHRDITARKEAELADNKQRQLLSFINKAQTIYLQQHDLSAACRQILPELTDLADSQFGFIAQMCRQQGKNRLFIHAITEHAWNEQAHDLVELYHRGELYFDSIDALFGQDILTGETVIFNIPQQHPSLSNAGKGGAGKGHPKIFRFLGLPIKSNNELVGMIGLANKTMPYTNADAIFFQVLSDALAGLFFAVSQAEARLKAEAQLKTLAMTDPITGLANRRAFVEHCQTLQNSATGVVLALLDISEFEHINKIHGNEIAEVLLKLVANMLKTQLRATDFCARFGSSEFVILIEHTEIDGANMVLENLCMAVSSLQFERQTQSVPLAVNIGARFISSADDIDISSQMVDADTALATAKASGANCLIWF